MNGLEKHEEDAFRVVIDELRWAKERFPRFADDLFQAIALCGEEYGETCMAINDYHFDGKPLTNVIVEAGQQAATAIRTICMALEIKEHSHADA